MSEEKLFFFLKLILHQTTDTKNVPGTLQLLDGRILVVRTRPVPCTRFGMTLLDQYSVPGMYVHNYSAITRYPVYKGIPNRNISNRYHACDISTSKYVYSNRFTDR